MNPAWVLIGYLWVCYVLNHADRQVVYTLFPALQKDFGFSDAALGLTATLRSTTVGVLNFVGALVSGFAPFLGGLARRTIGVDHLLSITGLVYFTTALFLLYGILRHFNHDHRKAMADVSMAEV